MSRPRFGVAAVSFDVTGTLIDAPRLGEQYAEVLSRHGIDLPADVIARTFPVVWQELSCRVPAGVDRFSAHPQGARGFWQELLARLCALLDAPRPSAFAAAELFDRFTRADAWSVHDDVEPCLERLGEAGLRLAVIANWDPRLETVLDELGLLSYFEVVVRSSALGVAKPAPAIFRLVAERLGLAPRRLLHVGDRALEDRDGAIAAGCQALLLDRFGSGGDLSSLHDLPAHLGLHRSAR